MPRSPGGCFFVMRTLVLFDGQNLFRSAKDAWGPSYPYDHPSYDVELLAQRLVSLTPGRTLEEIRFYTGVYRKDQDWERHWFWTNKLDHLETQGAYVYRGRVRGGLNEAKQEKGVDVSLAIDLIQATHEQRYDVGHHYEQRLGLRPCGTPVQTDRTEPRQTTGFRIGFPCGSDHAETVHTRSAGNQVGPYRPSHLRRLPRLE